MENAAMQSVIRQRPEEKPSLKISGVEASSCRYIRGVVQLLVREFRLIYMFLLLK